jgi:1,4-dihydroxy-2-naphthoate polyprenyltransferase
MNKTRVKIWLQAARLRTLPLACAAVLLGSGLAAGADAFRPSVFELCLLTAIGVQILSNLANDYGDAVSGADNEDRVGPQRTVVSGLITREQMQRAMFLVAGLTIISGLSLLWTAFSGDWLAILTFIGFGSLALIAAVTYTVGRRPYGYRGLGDLSVFLFFGLLGVLGTYYLFTQQFDPLLILPAASCGFLATGVLNINNIRDMDTDLASGKRTFASRLGTIWSRRYHWLLVLGAGGMMIVFNLLRTHTAWPWLFLPAWVPLMLIARVVHRSHDPDILDQQLKRTAMSSLLFNLLLAIGFALD